MEYEIFLADDAEKDIMGIFEYISFNDSPEKASYVYSRIKDCIINLNFNPERGHQPKEFEVVGVTEYLEIYFKPYRTIYQILNSNVFVHCVLDGRRDLEDLLHKRLLR